MMRSAYPRGQWFALVIAIALCVVAAISAMHGQPVIGSGAVAAIAGVGGLFWFGRRRAARAEKTQSAKPKAED